MDHAGSTEQRAVLSTLSERGPDVVSRVARFLLENGARVRTHYGITLDDHYGTFTLFSASPDEIARIAARCPEHIGDLAPVLRRTHPRPPSRGKVPFVGLQAQDGTELILETSRLLAQERATIVGAAGRFLSGMERQDDFALELQIELPEGSDPEDLEEKLNAVLSARCSGTAFMASVALPPTSSDHDPVRPVGAARPARPAAPRASDQRGETDDDR